MQQQEDPGASPFKMAKRAATTFVQAATRAAAAATRQAETTEKTKTNDAETTEKTKTNDQEFGEWNSPAPSGSQPPSRMTFCSKSSSCVRNFNNCVQT